MVLGFSLSARAQTTNLVWDPAGTGTDGAGTWNASSLIWTNPVGGGADIAWRNSTNDIAIFGAGSGAAGTVTVSGTVTNGGITFNAPGSGNYTLSSGTLFLGNTTPIVSNRVDATIGSIIGGASGLIKTGSGMLTLSGVNTYTGGTTINANSGILQITTTASALQGTVTVGSGSTNWHNAGNVNYQNNFSGAGTIKVTTGNGDVNGGGTSGDWSGFTGVLDLNQSVGSASKFRFNATTQAKLPAPTAIIKVNSGTTLYLQQGLLYGSSIQLFGAGNTENLGALRLETGAIQTNSVTLLANSFIGVNGSAASISGVISESGGSFGFTKQGNNTLTNSGANTYSGKTTITAGTVSVGIINNAGNSGGLGMNSTVDINGGTLQYTGAGETSDRVINLSGTTGGATINNSGAGLLKFTSNLTATNVGNKTLTLGGATGTGELAGNITNGPTGSTALTKSGANTWTLSAATNTFNGQLQINGGTLVWNTAGALAPAAGNFLPLNITAGGTLIVNGPLRYSSGSAGANGYLNVGNSAVGGIGTITINSGGSLTFTNQTGNPNSIVGQQGTGGTSKLTVNGGTFNWDPTGGLIVGNGNGSGLLLITNGGTATILKGTGNTEEGYIAIGRNSLTSTGTVYLASGTLATDRVIARGVATPIGVGYVYFDGGTLKALGNQSDWLQAAVSGNMNPPNAVTIADKGAKIDANGFSVAINNDLLHGGVSATDGGVTKLGLGTLTLGGSGHTFTGPTVVSNGTLSVTGSLPSASAVTIAGGKLTVSGSVGAAVSVQPGGAIGASSGTFSSLVTLASGNSAINLQDGSATTTTFASGLTLNNGNMLSFDLGSSSDQISVPGTFTHNGTATINLAAISGISTTTYTLISDAANDLTVTNGFVIGTVPGGYAATLGVSGGSLTVTLTQSAPGVAYWKGDVDNKWNTLTGGINSNWAADSTGATDTGAPPGTPTAVTFAATGAANFNTILGVDFTINSLTLSTANNVTIGGTTNTLTIIGGLLNDTTALNNVLTVSNVVLGSSQTWQNNSANPLTVSSKISGASDLTFGGTGTIVLVNANNNFAGTTVSGGTLQFGDGTTSNGSVTGDVTNNSTLTIANPAAQNFSGAISGSGQLVKIGAGTLTFPADNSYGSGTTISNGTLVIVTANGASTGTIDIKSGATLVCRPTITTTYANTVTGTGLVKLLFGDEGLGYNNGGDWFTYLNDLSGFNGTIQLSATTVTNVNKWDASAATVSGTSALIIDSGAQLYMNGNSLTFSTIQITGSGNYQNRGAVRAQAGTLTGAISLLGDTTFGTEGGTIAGTMASGTAGTQILTLGGTADLGGNITLSADIGGGTGAIALNKINTGTTTLSGVNTFTGPTTNSAGTLILANGSALQNSTLNITAGSLVFDSSVSSNAFVLGGLAGAVNITFANNASSAIDLTVGNSGGSTTYSGALNDNGAGSSLTKVGNGTLTLSGANNYSGATTVKGGTLVTSTLLTNATPGIAVDDGATLVITAVGTNQMAPATYTLGSSAGPVTNNFAGLSSTTIAPVNAGTLTLAGQTTVNINGGNFVVGNAYPLISYTSIGGAGGFKLGSLPRGMAASIVTNGGNTIALNVTSFAPVKNVWTGSVNTNWDIATTTNWQANGVADLYFDGDAARFDDTATATNVFVTTAVSPGSTIVSNISKTLTFTGSAIGGTGSLTKQGGGLLVLNQANTYNGNTVISNGTLQLGVANAIPGGAGKGDVTVGGTLDLNANSAVLNGLSGSGTVDTVAGGTPTLTVGSSGASSTFSGVIQNTAGNLTLTKNGNGTLVLSGTNAYTGATAVNQGSLDYTGTLGIAPATAAGLLTINNSGNNAIVNVSAPANIQFNNNNPLIGNNAAGAGALYQSGGTISGVNQLQLGAVTGGSYGYYKLSGGTNNMAELDLGSFNGAAVGVLDMSGGTINVANWFVPSRGTAAIGMLNMTGGTLNYSGPAGQFQGNWNGGVGTVVINLANASLLAPAADVSLMQTGAAGKLGEINLLTGGLLQANSIAPNSPTGDSVLNFNGGTLKADAATATFITANNTAVNVYGNGGTIDNNGANITIPVPLLAPAGDGINDPVTVDNGGSGYIGAPAVTFVGDGVGAAGYAVMSGGSVASIVMTSPGYGYSSATVVLTGGGGSGASATAPAPTPNTSGGMTFTGAGTNILTAANTYTGNTTVSNGTLLVNGSTSTGAVTVKGGTLGGTGTIGGAVTLNSGGTLAPGAGIGTFTISGNITLNAGATNAFEVDGSTPANDAVAAGGTVAYGGVLNIVPTGSFSSGQTFTLFSGAGAASASNFSSIAGSPGSGLAFAFTNGVLRVVTTGPSDPAQLTNSYSGGTLALSWPAGAGWRLQMQTNSLTIGLGNNWEYVTDGSISSTNITVDPAKPTVFYRLVYP